MGRAYPSLSAKFACVAAALGGLGRVRCSPSSRTITYATVTARRPHPIHLRSRRHKSEFPYRKYRNQTAVLAARNTPGAGHPHVPSCTLRWLHATRTRSAARQARCAGAASGWLQRPSFPRKRESSAFLVPVPMERHGSRPHHGLMNARHQLPSPPPRTTVTGTGARARTSLETEPSSQLSRLPRAVWPMTMWSWWPRVTSASRASPGEP